MFPDESRSSVLPLGKGQGELILWSVYTQCVLSLSALIKASPQGSGQTATPALRTLGWAKLPLKAWVWGKGQATDIPKVRTQGQMLKEFCEREEDANSKYCPGHSPTNPGGLHLRGPVGLRQMMKAESRGRCSGLPSL